MSENTQRISAFKPTYMRNIDPDLWEEYLREVIRYSLQKYRTCVAGVSQSYKIYFAVHLLELDMIYISEIRFYRGVEDEIYRHEYFIAHVKSSLGREGETYYLSFGRNSVQAAKYPNKFGPYVPYSKAGDQAKTLCKRCGFGEMGHLRGKLVGRICFTTTPNFAGSSSSLSTNTTPVTINQSLRLDELLITISSIHEKYPDYQDKLDCYWFTAFSFGALCALKSICYEKGKELLLLADPHQSEPLAWYTRHMKRRDILESDWGRDDMLVMGDHSGAEIREFEVTVDKMMRTQL